MRYGCFVTRNHDDKYSVTISQATTYTKDYHLEYNPKRSIYCEVWKFNINASSIEEALRLIKLRVPDVQF